MGQVHRQDGVRQGAPGNVASYGNFMNKEILLSFHRLNIHGRRPMIQTSLFILFSESIQSWERWSNLLQGVGQILQHLLHGGKEGGFKPCE